MPPKERLQFRESYTRYAQGRKEIKWRPGQEASLAPPCSNLRSVGIKCTVLNKVLVQFWDFSAPTAVMRSPHSDSTPGELCPTCHPRYAPGYGHQF